MRELLVDSAYGDAGASYRTTDNQIDGHDEENTRERQNMVIIVMFFFSFYSYFLLNLIIVLFILFIVYCFIYYFV